MTIVILVITLYKTDGWKSVTHIITEQPLETDEVGVVHRYMLELRISNFLNFQACQITIVTAS